MCGVCVCVSSAWGGWGERERKNVCTQERERACGGGERERERVYAHRRERKRGRESICTGWGADGERKSKSTRMRGRERARECLAPPFICFLPPALPYANWAQPGVLFYLKSSLRSSDFSLTFLCSIFTGFSLSCLLATSILDSFSLF